MPKWNNTKINEAINLLLEIKHLFRQISPSFSMAYKQKQEVQNKLQKLNEILNELNIFFETDQHKKSDKSSDFKNKLKFHLFVVSSSKNRRKLINLGLNKFQIITTGGPISIADIKTLSANLTQSNIENYRTKIEKFWEMLQKKIRTGNFKKIILLLEDQAKIDLLLQKNVEKFKEKITLPFQMIKIESFNILNNRFFSSIDINYTIT
ncbi:MAG: DUF2100 domain-containing protein [Candidatus Helarchaeota archaeon]